MQTRCQPTAPRKTMKAPEPIINVHWPRRVPYNQSLQCCTAGRNFRTSVSWSCISLCLSPIVGSMFLTLTRCAPMLTRVSDFRAEHSDCTLGKAHGITSGGECTACSAWRCVGGFRAAPSERMLGEGEGTAAGGECTWPPRPSSGYAGYDSASSRNGCLASLRPASSPMGGAPPPDGEVQD